MKLIEAHRRASENSIVLVLREGGCARAIGTGKGNIRRFFAERVGQSSDDNVRLRDRWRRRRGCGDCCRKRRADWTGVCGGRLTVFLLVARWDMTDRRGVRGSCDIGRQHERKHGLHDEREHRERGGRREPTFRGSPNSNQRRHSIDPCARNDARSPKMMTMAPSAVGQSSSSGRLSAWPKKTLARNNVKWGATGGDQHDA